MIYILVLQEKWHLADLLKILNDKLEVAEETFHLLYLLYHENHGRASSVVSWQNVTLF